jgi:hypothetical protein
MSRKSSANQRSRSRDSAWCRLRRSPAQGARLPSTCRFARAVAQVCSLPGTDSSSCGTRLDGAASNRPAGERLTSAAFRPSAFTSNRPGDVSRKTTSSPGANWSACRMPAGRVTLPRVWTVADRCMGCALRARVGLPGMLDTVGQMGSIAAISSLKWQIGDELPHGGGAKSERPRPLLAAGGLRTPGLAAGRRILGRGDGFP